MSVLVNIRTRRRVVIQIQLAGPGASSWDQKKCPGESPWESGGDRFGLPLAWVQQRLAVCWSRGTASPGI